MEKPSIERIHEVMRSLGMKVFETPYSVTLGGIRTKDNESGKFNDWLFGSYFTEDGGIKSIIIPGTTDAGLYYRLNPINPKGTAIIQHSKQYRGVYRLEDPDRIEGQRGHKGQEAFSQIGDMDYWRDADRDNYLEFDGPEETTNNRTNGHDMGDRGEDVGKWSAGCWGAIRKLMQLLYDLGWEQVDAGLGDIFSYAMLHETDFE